jgi:cytochrome c oxidase cbb3-type subunit 2
MSSSNRLLLVVAGRVAARGPLPRVPAAALVAGRAAARGPLPRVPAAALLFLLAGCAPRAETAPVGGAAGAGSFFGAAAQRPPPARTASREAGARLYASLCRSCHGHDGGGETALARELSPTPPADLRRCNFKVRSTPSGSLPSDEDLLRTLAIGLPGSSMIGFGALLSDDALRALVLEVKARCVRFAEEKPDAPSASGAAPLYEAASVERGAAVYRRERCASCHGEAGRGDGPAARALKDLAGRALRPRDHTRGVFRSGFGRADLYRAFSTGLDGTPMPALPASVAARDRWDLAHYLVSLSHDRSRWLRFLESPPSFYEPARAWGLPWR